MAFEDLDRQEVDQLVHDLASRKKIPAPVPVAASAMKAAAEAPPATSAPAAPLQEIPSRGRRWSSNRLLMPSGAAGSRKSSGLSAVMTMQGLDKIGFGRMAMPKVAVPQFTQEQWTAITARMFVVLGILLSAALPYWPYANSCSWGLGLYLTAVTLVIITGIWGAKLTWDARLGRSHSAAIAVVLWGVALVAAEVLPRIGYAQSTIAQVCS